MLTAAAAGLRELPFSPVLVVGAYVLAGLAVFPVTVLIAAAIASIASASISPGAASLPSR